MSKSDSSFDSLWFNWFSRSLKVEKDITSDGVKSCTEITVVICSGSGRQVCLTNS